MNPCRGEGGSSGQMSSQSRLLLMGQARQQQALLLRTASHGCEHPGKGAGPWTRGLSGCRQFPERDLAGTRRHRHSGSWGRECFRPEITEGVARQEGLSVWPTTVSTTGHGQFIVAGGSAAQWDGPGAGGDIS